MNFKPGIFFQLFNDGVWKFVTCKEYSSTSKLYVVHLSDSFVHIAITENNQGWFSTKFQRYFLDVTNSSTVIKIKQICKQTNKQTKFGRCCFLVGKNLTFQNQNTTTVKKHPSLLNIPFKYKIGKIKYKPRYKLVEF